MKTDALKKHLRNLERFDADTIRRDGYLRLDMNENVLGLPKSVVNGVFRTLTPNVLAGYPQYGELRKKLAKHNSLRPENICLTCGSDSAIKLIYEAYVSPGDKVIVTDPTFAMYPVYCDMYAAKMISVPYPANFKFPAKAFLSKMTKGVRLAVAVSPNNPIGSIIELKDLKALIKKAHQNGILLIVDEAYVHSYDVTVMKDIKKYDNLIVLRTSSKLLGLAGVRFGYAAAHAKIIKDLRRVQPTFEVNAVAVAFFKKLLDSPTIVKKFIAEVKGGKKYLVAQLKKANIPFYAGYSNYLLIKCGEKAGPVMDGLKKKKILIHGRFKQPILKNYIRVTIGPVPVMKRFWSEFSRTWRTI